MENCLALRARRKAEFVAGLLEAELEYARQREQTA